MKHVKTLCVLAVLLGFRSGAAGQEAHLSSVLPADDAGAGKEHVLLGRVHSGELSLASTGFEENKGQVVTTSGGPAPFVRYRLSQGGANIFLLDGGIAYQFSRVHVPEGYAELRMKVKRDAAEEARLEALQEQARLETYRMDMVLEGADRNARISTEGRSADYTNYYNHDALDVRTWTRVIYHEVYPGIDWSIASTKTGVEYDFILRPGADPGLIKLRFKAHEELFVDDDGNLIHGNRLGRFTEQRPVSFQDDQPITTRFKLEDDLLSFEVGAYDHERTLTIDPPRVWGTYYGGLQDDYAQGVAVDGGGNVFLAGYTKSTTGIATAGAQQTVWVAEDDAMLVKFNASGVRQWGTYYGGAVGDAFSSCAVDITGNIYAAGITKSTAAIATAGAHQTTQGGDWDGLLVKLNSSGVRQWATYYGGTGEDRGYACSVDGITNVYMTGLTFSDANIATIGSHQATRGGFKDAYLVKFNTSGVRQWGTYYGGGSDEDALGCCSDAAGNTFIAGGTGTSAGTAIATAGSHQATFGTGGADAFLAKFNPTGVRQWGTYYGGTASDYGFACAVDGSGNVFMSGDCFSTNGTSIATAGAHQTSIGGGGDAFLVKFNSTGARQWGTYYGGVAGEAGRGCQTDGAGNGYLVGTTQSSTGIAFNGHQNTFGGAPDDAFLARFLPTGVRDFGTYYGGTASDNGYTCAVSNSGDIHLVGSTLSDNAISASGHQNLRGGVSDAFLAKFDPTTSMSLRMFLQGPLNPTTLIMDDGLRIAGLVPVAEPYTALGFTGLANTGATITTGVLLNTGNNAVVDWVLLEARDPTLNTVLSRWALLLQRDGDVMMPTGSGISLDFPAPQVRLAVRHRNHFGCMSTAVIDTDGGTTAIDFTVASTAMYGTEPRATVSTARALWSGDVTRDGQLKYTGSANDRDPILVAVGSTTPNNTVAGYSLNDVTMDGLVKYTGTGNDRDPILLNVGSTTPNNVRLQQLP